MDNEELDIMDNNDGDFEYDWGKLSIEEVQQVLREEQAVWCDEHSQWWTMSGEAWMARRIPGSRGPGGVDDGPAETVVAQDCLESASRPHSKESNSLELSSDRKPRAVELAERPRSP